MIQAKGIVSKEAEEQFAQRRENDDDDEDVRVALIGLHVERISGTEDVAVTYFPPTRSTEPVLFVTAPQCPAAGDRDVQVPSFF